MFRRNSVWRTLYWFLFGLSLTLFLSGLLLVFQGRGFSQTPASPTTPAPTAPPVSQIGNPTAPVSTLSWNGVALPDWGQITFSSMPPITEGGSFTATPDMVTRLGYDPSRSWQTGQNPASFTMIGDFQDSFRLQEFDLSKIGEFVGQTFDNIRLSDFGVMKFQNLQSLVEAVPGLGDFPVDQVKPVFDLLTTQVPMGVDSSQTLSQLLAASPQLGELPLASLPLDQYSITDIPNLQLAQLGNFQNWQAVPVEQVPGLPDVPFSEFPNPIMPVGTSTGQVDIVFGNKEHRTTRTMSGSDIEGFSVPCYQDCAHVEFAGNESVRGHQWVSGKYQEVKGGRGILASVNNGMEPTGRHPFGEAMKVAIWDVSETQGRFNTALFFRICIRNAFVDLGCTPYFIGPVPWFSYEEKSSMVFLGPADWKDAQTDGGSVSTNALDPSTERRNNSAKPSFNGPTFTQQKHSNCASYGGVYMSALSNAISDIEGDYDSVGAWSCVAGNCGRPLGTHQMMSYREDVRKTIASKPGGEAFLQKLDSGEPVGGQEMFEYFNDADQNALFEAESSTLINRASSEIDPQTNEPFTGQRLIERVGQMHFGGPAIPIDSGASDIHGSLTVRSYGQKVAATYQQATLTSKCGR